MSLTTKNKKRLQQIIVVISLVALGVMLVFGFYSTHLVLTARPDHFFDPSSQSYHADSVIKIKLPDSSFVWLNRNADFGIDSAYGKKSRTVYLRGEAYFEIQKDTVNPFRLITDHIQAETDSASFSIREYQYTTTLYLLTGSANYAVKDKNKSTLVTKGYLSIFDKISGEFRNTQFENENFLSWYTHCFNFRNDSLISVCKLLSEVYKTPVFIDTKALENVQISAKFENKSTSEILEALALEADCQVVFKKNSITLKSK